MLDGHQANGEEELMGGKYLSRNQLLFLAQVTSVPSPEG